MSNVIDIKSHPKFRHDSEPDPADPDFEHQEYLRYLDLLDGAELRREMEDAERFTEALFEKLEPVEHAVCSDCLYRQDPRTTWRKVRDWFLVTRRNRNPICTHGVVQYCRDKNPRGDCPAFKPILPYQK